MASAEEPSCTLFNWFSYPDEFTGLIFMFLTYKDLSATRQVCKTWNDVGGLMQRTPRFMKDKYLLRWNEFIQVDDSKDTEWTLLEASRTSIEDDPPYILWTAYPHTQELWSETARECQAVTDPGAWVANVGVWRGRYYFEVRAEFRNDVVLKLNDVRFGWCMPKNFGDHRKTAFCCLYDPTAALLWCDDGRYPAKKYGEILESGDIIGCAIDGETGITEFWHNGHHLGHGAVFGKSESYEDEVQLYYPKVEFNADTDVAVTVNLVGPFVSLPPGYRAVGDVDCSERLELRSFNLKMFDDISRRPERVTAIKLGLYKATEAELCFHWLSSQLSPSFNDEELYVFTKPLAHLFGMDPEEIANSTPTALQAFVEDKATQIVNSNCLTSVAFFFQKYTQECESKRVQNKYFVQPIHKLLYPYMLFLRLCDVTFNPLQKDMGGLPEYTDEEREILNRLGNHPLLLAANNLNTNDLWDSFTKLSELLLEMDGKITRNHERLERKKLQKPSRKRKREDSTTTTTTTTVEVKKEAREREIKSRDKEFRKPNESEELHAKRKGYEVEDDDEDEAAAADADVEEYVFLDTEILHEILEYLAPLKESDWAQYDDSEAFAFLAKFYFMVAPMVPIPWSKSPPEFLEHTYYLALYFWEESTGTIRRFLGNLPKDELKKDAILFKNSSYLTEEAQIKLIEKYPCVKEYLPSSTGRIMEFLAQVLPLYVEGKDQDRDGENFGDNLEPYVPASILSRAVMCASLLFCAMSAVWYK